jgi:hypothetical protein
MRVPILMLALASVAPALVAREAPREFVHAVEFPYYLYPRALWGRELVWLKTIGIRTVAFSVPWNWHETVPGDFDLTGRTSPRKDLMGFLRVLRRLGLRAWIRPLPPVKSWRNNGYPEWVQGDRGAARQWLARLESELAPHLESHGGPIAFVEGGVGFVDALPPPAPVSRISAADPRALVHSRRALASGRGSLLWEDVEDALFPAGWEATGSPLLRKGAVSLSGDERPSAAALRRNAALLKQWARLLSAMRPHGGSGRLPADVNLVQLLAANGPSVVSVINTSGRPFHGDLRVHDSAGRRRIVIPEVNLPAGEALWLPVHVPLAGGGLCKDCWGFSNLDHVVYATAELAEMQFENGILAMEFAAPTKGEVVVQLSRRPSGPLLAAGRLTEFDWDDKTMRVRLPIPEGKGPGLRVRIGLAIEPPDSSAFFVDPPRLIIGRSNRVTTSYSSDQLAARSRLRLPENYTAKAISKSPTEIDYDIQAPADALHGDWASLAIEADGVLLGQARLQLLRPASMRLSEAIRLHWGPLTELMVEPPIVPLDPKAGRALDVIVRNNFPQIQNYVLRPEGAGLKFFPERADVGIGPATDRPVSLRVFGEDMAAGLHPARLRLSGAAEIDMPVRFLVIPRGEALAYSADLDGDGAPEWVLENQHLRAVFSAQDGGRWLEFVWKDSGLNVLPEDGALAGAGPVEVRMRTEGADASLEFSGRDWRRTVRLLSRETKLIVEQTSPLPPETLKSEKKNELMFRVTREDAHRAIYSVERP